VLLLCTRHVFRLPLVEGCRTELREEGLGSIEVFDRQMSTSVVSLALAIGFVVNSLNFDSVSSIA